MAGTRYGSVLRQVQRLFDRGTVAGLGEGQLLRRFAESADEAAFEALVARHGPMVLGVCRRLLADPHAADDAFQATFLVLVKKAPAIRDGERLGPWLHGVATRVALRARAQLNQRRAREAPGAEKAVDDTRDRDRERAELRALLDEELEQIPARFRDPLVLCYLQGQTHDQAADRIGCPVGTVRSRLSKGRELLRGRLARRGLALPAAAFAATLEAEAKAAVVPPALLAATVSAALRVAGGPLIAAGAVSAGAWTLSEGVLTSMRLSTWKLAAGGLLALGLAGGGVGAAMYQQGDGRPAAADTVFDRLNATLREVQAQADQARLREAELTAKVRRLEQQLAARPAGEGGGATDVGGVGRPETSMDQMIQMMGMGGLAATAPPPKDPEPRPRFIAGGRAILEPDGRIIYKPNAQASEDTMVVRTDRGFEAYSLKTDRWSKYERPEGVEQAVPVSGRGVMALGLRGPAISQVAVIVEGQWYPQDLPTPASGRLSPTVGVGWVSYESGRTFCVFSVEAKRWGVLELKESNDFGRNQLVGGDDYLSIEGGGELHLFNIKTGRWSAVEPTKD